MTLCQNCNEQTTLYQYWDEQTKAAVEAEESLFGSVILDPTTIDSIGDIVSGKDFYDEPLGKAFDLIALRYRLGEPIGEMRVLADHLKRAGLLDQIGGSARVARAAGIPNVSSVEYYAREVRNWPIFVENTWLSPKLSERSELAVDQVSRKSERDLIPSVHRSMRLEGLRSFPHLRRWKRLGNGWKQPFTLGGS